MADQTANKTGQLRGSIV